MPLYTLDDMKEMVSKAGVIMANLEFETDSEVQARLEAFEKIESKGQSKWSDRLKIRIQN